MPVAPRIAEVVALLEDFALGKIDLPERRVAVALRLLDLIPDARPPDDGAEALMSAFAFPRKFSA
jgi:hypothetical protein